MQLNANIALRGSVARSGDRVRVFAELIQISNAHRLWGETYERTVSDLFTLEHEISNSVSSALGDSIWANRQRPVVHQTTQ